MTRIDKAQISCLVSCSETEEGNTVFSGRSKLYIEYVGGFLVFAVFAVFASLEIVAAKFGLPRPLIWVVMGGATLYWGAITVFVYKEFVSTRYEAYAYILLASTVITVVSLLGMFLAPLFKIAVLMNAAQGIMTVIALMALPALMWRNRHNCITNRGES